MLAQTGGGCRATNYVAIARKAFKDAGMSQIPVIALGGEKQAGFPVTLPLFGNLLIGIIYGDLLMRVLYKIRPYEKFPGSAQKLYDYWVTKCRYDLLTGGKHNFKDNIFGIVRDFDSLAIDEHQKKF